MNDHKNRLAAVLLALALGQLPQLASAADNASLDALSQQLDAMRQQQRETQRQIDALERQLDSLRGDKPSQAAQAAAKAAPAATSAADNNAAPGKFTLDTGLTYTHYDRKQLALQGLLALDSIFLGNISVDNVKADTLTLDMDGRYQLNDRWQVDLDAPFVWRTTTFESGGANGGDASAISEQTVTMPWKAGDVSVGATYKWKTETTARPEVDLNFRVKAPTGTDPYGYKLQAAPDNNNLQAPVGLASGNGLWQLSGGVSASKTLDPVVVFGNMQYFHNLSRHFGDIDPYTSTPMPGNVRLGDSIQYGLGAAFALNDRFSLTTSFTQRFMAHSSVQYDGHPWQTVAGSEANMASLNFGATYALDRKTAWTMNLAAGLTPDTPNAQLGVRYIHSF